MGQAKDLPLAVLRLDSAPRQALAELLGVQDVRRVRYMFVRGGLDLRRLVHFLRGFEVGSDTGTMGAMVCCFATLLFITGDLIVDVSVIFAVRQVMGGFPSEVPLLFYTYGYWRGLGSFQRTRSLLASYMIRAGSFVSPLLMLSLGQLGGLGFCQRVLGLSGCMFCGGD